MARLRSIMLLMLDVPRTANFFREGLGCKVVMADDSFAEVQTGEVNIMLKSVQSIAESTKGYSPFLNFEVDDIDGAISRLIYHGGSLDGPIKYPAHGKVAAVQAPCGHMISLFEPNSDLLTLQSRLK
ncbi:hypothetical protein GUITHDRAFT_164159 [Guillardia theta CCMP2712]|uniref:VOC domain-containing protein n=2 Tax=Guillardia theta TaxID=55529 RepID=L1J2L2_GUITC|nr:hypothetical protein GUITHDRAFT_164159 [Guillardia theta CCMP2712]EKX42364.1 hypothetical protein GUITHDRAFT_164159 [Guillardia theta CCMP2712]|eukprot:XP_005829344.1 hypothetical protein GUITHDRAFT_164159 [Guillardia theta CCMP2712]